MESKKPIAIEFKNLFTQGPNMDTKTINHRPITNLPLSALGDKKFGYGCIHGAVKISINGKTIEQSDDFCLWRIITMFGGLIKATSKRDLEFEWDNAEDPIHYFKIDGNQILLSFKDGNNFEKFSEGLKNIAFDLNDLKREYNNFKHNLLNEIKAVSQEKMLEWQESMREEEENLYQSRLPFDRLVAKLKLFGYSVVDSTWGKADDHWCCQPIITFDSSSKEENEKLREKMQDLLNSFYVHRISDKKNKIKIATIEGLGIAEPRYGFRIYSGTLDDMGNDTGIDPFIGIETYEIKALQEVLNKYRSEMVAFSNFVS